MRTVAKTMPPDKRSYHHGSLRPALIQAGLELIAQEGVRALTLREMGARLGVSRSAAYRHFTGKEQLLAAIRAAGFEIFANALEKGRDAGGPAFAAQLKGMGLAYVNFAHEHPAYFEVMFNGPPENAEGEKCAAEERAFRVLEQLIVDGQASGAARKGDARTMACAAWALVHGISALRLEKMPLSGGTSREEFTFACCDLLLNGLAAPAAKK